MPAPKAAPLVVRLAGVGVVRGGAALLRGIDWSVRAGEDWAVVGPNGSGMSTLLGLLTGYVWPTAGTVEVFGERLGRVDVAALRRRIGIVSAFVGEEVLSLAGERVEDVVLSGRDASFGLYRAALGRERDEAAALLSAFDAEALGRRPFRTLSQGEKQRVLLARAWMAAPDLLILDEPATGLDIAAREELVRAVEALRDRSPRPTILHVTHHVEEIGAGVRRSLLLQGGRCLAAGPTREVLTDERLSRAYGLPLTVAWQGGRAFVRPLGPA